MKQKLSEFSLFNQEEIKSSLPFLFNVSGAPLPCYAWAFNHFLKGEEKLTNQQKEKFYRAFKVLHDNNLLLERFKPIFQLNYVTTQPEERAEMLVFLNQKNIELTDEILSLLKAKKESVKSFNTILNVLDKNELLTDENIFLTLKESKRSYSAKLLSKLNEYNELTATRANQILSHTESKIWSTHFNNLIDVVNNCSDTRLLTLVFGTEKQPMRWFSRDERDNPLEKRVSFFEALDLNEEKNIRFLLDHWDSPFVDKLVSLVNKITARLFEDRLEYYRDIVEHLSTLSIYALKNGIHSLEKIRTIVSWKMLLLELQETQQVYLSELNNNVEPPKRQPLFIDTSSTSSLDPIYSNETPVFSNQKTLKAPIDRKYLGGTPLSLDSLKKHQKNNGEKKSKGICDQKTDKIICEFIPLEQQNKGSQIEKATAVMGYIRAQNKAPITASDKCIFVMCGRGEQALIPKPPFRARIVLVVTEEEYQTLSITEGLSHYDFLISSPFTVGFRETSKNSPGLINSRRRTADGFAARIGLPKPIEVDDNIKEIHIATSALKSAILPLPFDALYLYLSDKMDENNDVSMSVQSYHHKGRVVNDDVFGGKVTMDNLSEQLQLMPELKEHSYVRVPEDDGTMMEDFYKRFFIQSLLTIKGIGKQGIRRAPRDEIQLIRSKSHKSKAKKSVNSAEEISLSNVWKNHCQSISPTLLRVLEMTVDNYNESIRENLQRYEQTQERRRNEDVIKTISQNFGLANTPIPAANSSFNELINVARTFPNLYEFQKNALSFIDSINGNKNKRGSLNIATGCGKSWLIALTAFAKLRSEPNKSVIIISPTVVLSRQLQQELRSIAEDPNLPEELYVPSGRINGIFSEDEDTIPIEAFYQCKTLQQKAGIDIVCYGSVNRILDRDQQQKTEEFVFFENVSMIINDESHLVDKEKVGQKFLNLVNKPMKLNFSATPHIKKNENEDSLKFVYSREQAIEDKVLCPLQIDNSLPENVTLDELVHLLTTLSLPVDCVRAGLLYQNYKEDELLESTKKLIERKGIIYVKGQKESELLALALKNIPNAPSVYQINYTNPNKEKDIAKFKSENAGIAIAIRQLREGFSDKDIYWMIVLNPQFKDFRENHNHSNDITQMLGRILRKNQDEDKISLAIFPKSYRGFGKLFHGPKGQYLPWYDNIESSYEEAFGEGDDNYLNRHVEKESVLEEADEDNYEDTHSYYYESEKEEDDEDFVAYQGKRDELMSSEEEFGSESDNEDFICPSNVESNNESYVSLLNLETNNSSSCNWKKMFKNLAPPPTHRISQTTISFSDSESSDKEDYSDSETERCDLNTSSTSMGFFNHDVRLQTIHPSSPRKRDRNSRELEDDSDVDSPSSPSKKPNPNH